MIHINDLTEGLTTNVELLADDKDLKRINNWIFQGKMDFNLDSTKQIDEVLFSRKAKEIDPTPLVFNNTSVS